MSGIATAIVAGAVISGVAAKRSADKGAAAAKYGTDTAVGESRRQFDIQRGDQLPFIETGQSALARLRQLFGLSRGDDPGGEGDLSVFEESPGYQFRKEQGEAAINRSLATRGKALSGEGVTEGIRFASGLASQEFGSFFDRLASLAGIGQTGAAISASAGSASAGQVGRASTIGGIAEGNARASGYEGINNAIQGGLSNFLLLQQLNSTPAGLGSGGGFGPQGFVKP